MTTRTKTWQKQFEPIKDNRGFLEQEYLPSLLSTGWLQERIRA